MVREASSLSLTLFVVPLVVSVVLLQLLLSFLESNLFVEEGGTHLLSLGFHLLHPLLEICI